MEDKLSLAQVAFVCDQVDIHSTSAWYQRVLGFLPAGWTDEFGGPELARLQRLSDPDCKMTLSWLVERNEDFQLELFEYEQPASRPRPAAWTPRDIGYVLTTLFVEDFEGALERARDESAVRAEPTGPEGARRALIADPNGILLELLEEDVAPPAATARPEVGVAIRSVRASVPDLEKSLAFFRDTCGLELVDRRLHEPEHEALWGLAGAEPEIRVLAAGEIFLELAQYRDPAGSPRPDDHQLSDGGVMNIALATDSMPFYEEMRDRIEAAGYESREFIPGEQVAVSYVADDQGFSLELLYMAKEAYADFGFVPVPPAAGAPSPAG